MVQSLLFLFRAAEVRLIKYLSSQRLRSLYQVQLRRQAIPFEQTSIFATTTAATAMARIL